MTQALSREEPGSLPSWSERLADLFAEAATSFSNEMELREHVHTGLLLALNELYGLSVQSSAGEFETNRGSGPRRTADRLYGGVVVEWEWSMSSARREHGASQALEYLENLRRAAGNDAAFTAVVTDGKQWGFLRWDPASQPIDLFSESAPQSATEHFMWVPNSPAALRQFLELIGSHQQIQITGRSLANRFGPDSDIASRIVTILGQSIAGRLPGDRIDTLYSEWRRALDVVYGDLDSRDSALSIAVQSHYRLPVARPLGETLFSLHTYFALLARMIAVELLAVTAGSTLDAPSFWRGLDDDDLLSELEQLEHGRLPGSMMIANLFEADLFSWWADSAGGNRDLLEAFRGLLGEISGLAFPRIAYGPGQGADVLRDLYQALVPRELRRALGEFLTPQWLAEASLERLRAAGAPLLDGKVLDPTCGTGTFIIPLLSERLNRLAREHGEDVFTEQVQAVLDSVAGIDLNPVAIVAARVNYVLALGELAHVGGLTLPVWRADSIVVPELAPTQVEFGELAGISHLRLETSLEEPFVFPLSMASASGIGFLSDLLSRAIEDFSIGGATDEEFNHATAYVETALRTRFLSDPDFSSWSISDEVAVATALLKQLLELEREGLDGIWVRLIENAFAPTLAGRFDVVVGNPPWLTWTKLPEGWRRKTERIWKRLGLWHTPIEAGDSYSLQSGDIATLVFGVTLERYLAEGGFVGFLTPASIINADPGNRAFRQFRLRPDRRDWYEGAPDVPFSIRWIDDWSKVAPFAPDAANKPIFVVAQSGSSQGRETPGAIWSRSVSRRGLRDEWRSIRATLEQSLGHFAPVDPNVSTSAWRFQADSSPKLIAGGTSAYSFGKGLDTRGANGTLFVDVSRPKGAVGGNKATVQVINRPEEGRNPNVTALSGRVEADLVFPLLRGKDVSHWSAVASGYIVAPHRMDASGEVFPVAELSSQYPSVLQWLRRHREQLASRKAPPHRSWDMSASGSDWYRIDGPLGHMASEHLVVVRELSSRPAAAVIRGYNDWDLGGRHVRPLVDHKLLFCAVGSQEEALYLAAMINSTPMQDLLESFVNSIAVSPKSLKRLPIPHYSEVDEAATVLVGIASQFDSGAHLANDGLAAELTSALDAEVLKLIAFSGEYSPQPRRPRGSRNSRPAAPPASDLPPLF